MQTSLKAIADKAKRLKKHRFQNLFRMLNEELLLDSWNKLNQNAAVGSDGVSYQEYGKNVTENVRKLVENLKNRRYRAKLVRRHYIPKGNGKVRPLGIPAIEDKLLQCAVMQILQAIYEQDFLPCSFGYRPNRGAHDAVDELDNKLFYRQYNWVVEADIKGFFERIDHGWMIRMLEQRIDDKALIWLIRKWLRASVMDTDGKVIHPATGTPQGGIISPILANIYMHYALNLWFEKVFKKHCRGEAYLCVYADDFVTAFQYKEDAQRFYDVLGQRLGKFNLTLSLEKTNIIRFSRYQRKKNGTFGFLGFEFRWVQNKSGKDWLRRSTLKKKLRNSLKNFKEWCKENRNMRLRAFFKDLNSKLRGYYNYYGVIGNSDSLWTFYYRMLQILFKSLNSRSQMTSYNWVGFKEALRHFRIEKPRTADRYAQILAYYEARGPLWKRVSLKSPVR